MSNELLCVIADFVQQFLIRFDDGVRSLEVCECVALDFDLSVSVHEDSLDHYGQQLRRKIGELVLGIWVCVVGSA